VIIIIGREFNGFLLILCSQWFDYIKEKE